MRLEARFVVALLAPALGLACQRTSPQPPASSRPVTGEVDAQRPLPSPLPTVAARVNGQAILMLRVAALARASDQRGDVKLGPNPRVLREALRELMGRELLFQEAVARGVQADPRDVERGYDELRGAPASEDEWLTRLRGEGLDANALREELRVRATVTALRHSLVARTPEQVTDEEAAVYLESHPEAASEPARFVASQILVRVPPDTGQDESQRLRARAAQLAARARQGESFALLASRESDDEHTRISGGRLPELRSGQFDPALEAALRQLSPGQVSEPVVTALGYHVLRLEQYTPVLPASGVDALRRAKEGLVREAGDAALARLLGQLEARAKIEVFL